MRKITLFTLLILSASAGAQTIYKCAQPSGEVNYSSSPCPAGHEQLWARESSPANPGSSGSRPSSGNTPEVHEGPRTAGGHVACISERWLDDMIQFVISKDQDSVAAYVEQTKCIILKPGIRVSVTDSPGMLGGKVEFVAKGVRLWSAREAIIYQ